MTTVDAILKEVYGPRIENQLQNETVALKRIERTSDGVTETVGGKYVDFPIRVSRNTGIGYRNENEQLMAAGQQGYAEVHVPLRYGYGRVRLTGQVMTLAEKNFQAFASAMDDEMEGIKDDLAKDSNRVVYGDSSGLLAVVTADGVNTVTVNNAQYLEIGMSIDILTIASGAVIAATRTITAISAANVVTYSGADVAATATTDGLFRAGNYGREPSGLGNIVSATATLHGLTVAAQPKWASLVRTNPAGAGTNRALSEGLMIETCDLVRVQGGKTSLILGSLGVRRAYFNLLTQQRRYADTKEFAGGFSGLVFNYGTEIPMVEDVDAPPSKMRFLDESKFKVYRNKEWHWADDDGSVLKWVHDYDVWEGILRQYWEIGVASRNAQASLDDITEG
jgi:hypothetical protein